MDDLSRSLWVSLGDDLKIEIVMYLPSNVGFVSFGREKLMVEEWIYHLALLYIIKIKLDVYLFFVLKKPMT